MNISPKTQRRNRPIWKKKSSLLRTAILAASVLPPTTSLADSPYWLIENDIDLSLADRFAAPMVVEDTLPDLIVSEVDITNMETHLQTLKIKGQISVALKNIGDDSSPPALVTLFEDTNHNGTFDDGVDNTLGAQVMPAGLAPDEELSMAIPVRGTVAFREVPIYAMVDSNQQIDELNEDNNLNSSMSLCAIQPELGTFEPVQKWAWSGSSVLPDYNQVMSTPMVAPLEDTNNDGTINDLDVPSVIFNTFRGGHYTSDGVLRAISGQDGHEIWTVSDPAYRTYPGRGIAAADIDGDGLVEIVTMKSGGGAIAFEHTGAFKWQTTVSLGGNASIANLDGVGLPEIVFGRSVLNADGTLRWTGTAFGGRGISAVADINLDGQPEIVAGGSAYFIKDGQLHLLWRNNAVGDGFVAIGNFNQDNYPEVVVVVPGGKVYLLDHQGQIIWGPISIPGGGHGGPPTIADMDGDGVPEIGVAGGSRYVALKADSSILWTSNTWDTSSSQTGSSVFDFDGDGQAEVVYSDQSRFRVYRGSNGTVLFETPNPSGTLWEMPIVADVDNDNHADIVICANNYAFSGPTGIRVFQDKNNSWVNTRKIWNQHTYHVTNINDDGTVPAVEQNSWEVHNTYRLNAMPELSATWLPDLTASLLRGKETAEGVVTLTARIGNGGAIRSPDNVKVAFYQGDPNNGGTLLGVVTIGSIAPGAYQEANLEVAMPEVPRVIDLTVVVDYDEKVIECDETNNRANALVRIERLLAELADLTARKADNGTTILQWKTLAELDNAGFFLWRAVEDGKGGYTNITLLGELNSHQAHCITGELTKSRYEASQLISAAGDARTGACYVFTDNTVSEDGTYYYVLEDVGMAGERTFHCQQAAAITVGQGTVIHLEAMTNYCQRATGSK